MSDFEMFAGDSKVIQIDVTDEANNPVDLTNADLGWYLSTRPSGTPFLGKSIGAGITRATPQGGSVPSRMVIAIAAGEISTSGVFYYGARVIIGGTVETVRAGAITVTQAPRPI